MDTLAPPRATLLTRFVSHAFDHMSAAGIDLEIWSDPADLAAFYAIHRDPAMQWAGPPACIDPDTNDLGAHNALAVIGRESTTGAVVVTRAARLFDLRAGTLYDHLTRLEWLYPDPATMACPGETFEFADGGGIAARAITGRVNFAIGGWHHPTWRGNRFSGVMSPLVRALAMLRWSPDHFCSLVETALADSMYRAYGFMGREDGITWANTRKFPVAKQTLFFMTGEAAERQIAGRAT